MLVEFSKGFIMEGEASFLRRKKLFSKKELERTKIYRSAGISGICDESEVEAEVDRLIKKQLNSRGWGDEFHGWQKILTYEESLHVAELQDWDDNAFPKNKLRITYLDNWTVEKAAKILNGKQFAQYCRDYGITIKEVI